MEDTSDPNQTSNTDDDEDEDGEGGGGGIRNSGPSHPLVIHGNVFRILGDGRQGDILVRIEAYVMRTPLEDNAYPALPPVAESLQITDLNVNEQFRILDWKVIR